MRSIDRRTRIFLWLPILLLGAVVVSLGTAMAVAAPVEGGRMPVEKMSWDQIRALPDGQRIIDRELDRQRIYHERWHQVHDMLGGKHVSSKSRQWLQERGLGPARLANPSDAAAKAGVDTLRVLLIRIAFEENRDPGLVTMAPDGDFFYEPRDSHPVLQIDPEPHDRAFFESHLRGLSEYYTFQSGGRLQIESRVLPDGDRDAYKLSDVADYGPGATDFWTIESLERLVRDMIAEADAGTQADGSVDLSDFDDDDPLTYIIFAHSGSDWQSDIFQDSPNDIPTFFVTLGEPQNLASGGQLSECSVIPETTTQDTYLGSIAAALYHEFGHALGLPDVYDATTGYTSVGIWDLMDSGTNLAANLGYYDPESGQIVGEPVTGVLPPSLSAWCKWFLGWVETDVIDGGDGQQYLLPAVGVRREMYSIYNIDVPGNNFRTEDPQVLVGGGSPGEFFLVENRWVPLTVDDTPYDPYDPGDPNDPSDDYGGLYLQTDATGVILYLGGSRRGIEGLNTGYYDYFMPEGGVLVWHANMDRIEAGLEFNTINAYGDGLKVVEADGIQDIGVLDAYVLGWYGSYTDVFAPWNDIGYDEVFVEGAGVPHTRAHDRSWTGVHLWDIDDNGSAHGAVMELQAAVEPLLSGWPISLPQAGDEDLPEPRAMDPASLTPLSDGTRMLVVGADAPPAGTAPLLFAWDLAGASAYGAVGGLPEGAVLALNDRPVGPPAAVTLTDGTDVLLVATADGTLQALEAGATGIQVVFAVTVADSLVAGPQPVPLSGSGPGLFCVVDATGLAHLIDENGLAVGAPTNVFGPGSDELVSPMRVATDGSDARILFVADGGWQWQGVGASGFLPDPTRWTGVLDGPAPLALMPADSDQRLVIFGPDGLQGCWLLAPDGAWADTDWPDPGAGVVCEPAVADLDGDGRLDLTAATAERLFAWQDNGVNLTGYPNDLVNLFPLPDSTLVAGPLVVADLADGPGNELAFATDRGHLFVLNSAALPVAGTPFRFGGGGASGLAAIATASDRFTLGLVDAGGTVGPPLDRRLTHGRVTLYDERVLPGGEPATATWIGPGGGPNRTGWVGTPSLVAGDSPADDPAHAEAVFYPNPLTDRNLTVRYWSATERAAELAIFNLQGELVLRQQIPTEADRVNEFTVELDVASGLYVARLTSEKVAGQVANEVKTVAVAR